MSVLFNYPKFKAFNSNGAPLNGGKLYAYIAGTTTAKTTYSDYNLSTENANPVVLDQYGEATVYLASGQYKFILKTSNDTTFWTEDNIEATTDSTFKYYVDSSEADQGAATAGGASTVKDFVDSIGATKKATLVFVHDGSGNTTSYTFGTSETIPSNIKLQIENGALLDIETGITVTINSPDNIDASRAYQIFNLNGTGKASFTNSGDVYPQWWNDAYGDGSTDCSGMFTIIEAALPSMPSEAAGTELKYGSIVFSGGDFAFDDDASTLTCVKFINGARWTIAAAKTVTINNTIDSPNTQIFVYADATAKVTFNNTFIPNANLTWWGAVQDALGAAEIASTTSALQYCIDSGTKHVHIPEGRWTINGVDITASGRQDLTIQGVGYGSRLTMASGQASTTFLLNFDDDGTGFTVKDLFLNGNNGGGTNNTKSNGIYLDTVAHCIIQDVWFEDFGEWAISCSTGSNGSITIQDCVCWGGDEPNLAFENGFQVNGVCFHISNCNFESLAGIAIKTLNSNGINFSNITGCYFENNTTNDIIGAFKSCLINNNYFNSATTGIVMQDASNYNIIEGNDRAQAQKLVEFEAGSTCDFNQVGLNRLDGDQTSAYPDIITWGVTRTNVHHHSVYDGFSAYLSGDQSVSNGVREIAEFDTEDYDPSGNFDTATYTYTIPTTGKYRVTLSAIINDLDDGEAYEVAVFKNDTGAVSTGTQVIYKNEKSSVANHDASIFVSKTLSLVKDDTLRAEWSHGHASALDIKNASHSTFFQVDKVG